MTCPSCGHDAPPGSAFCNGCGAALRRPGAGGQGSASTSAPGPPTPAPNALLPRHLADRVLASRSALEGERKQVTVLFADVAGSMELAEQMDPEEWSQIMQRFFAMLCDGVVRFEGFVDKFTGDGIMALFGAPIAHEDHARRACYAALHLRGELRRYADELRVSRGLNLAVRMGLSSGDVVVGKIGDDLRMEYTAQGHTVGLAQRMESIAESGHVFLTAHTAHLVEGFFELRDLGTTAVKGSRDPVRVYALEGPGTYSTRLDVSRARHPLCGPTPGAVARARRLVQLAEGSESPMWVQVAHLCAGLTHAAHGLWDEAIAHLERCREMAHERDVGIWSGPFALAGLADAYRAVGRPADARAAAEAGVDAARRHDLRTGECRAQLALARVLVADGAADHSVEAALARTRALVEDVGARVYLPFIAEVHAALARARGDAARAGAEAHRLFTEMGATGHAERLAKELGAYESMIDHRYPLTWRRRAMPTFIIERDVPGAGALVPSDDRAIVSTGRAGR